MASEFIDLPGLEAFKGEYDKKIAEKYVAKEAGKGLSANDFTDADKQKLDNLNAVKNYRGVVAAVADLPSTGNNPGDTFFVGAAAPYEEYIWTGTAWVDLGAATGSTTNYDGLLNRPQINGVTLTGNKTAADLDLLGTGTAVLLAGAQTVQGQKTFNDAILVPSPTQDAQAANKQYVDSAYTAVPVDDILALF